MHYTDIRKLDSDPMPHFSKEPLYKYSLVLFINNIIIVSFEIPIAFVLSKLLLLLQFEIFKI